MTTITYTCANEDCQHEFSVDVEFGYSAKTYGPPEQCYPAEPSGVDPKECPECGTEVDVAEAVEQAADWLNDYEED